MITITIKKAIFFYLAIGIVAIILLVGGWYIYKYRGCTKMINYIPPREGKNAGSGVFGAVYSLDKGDYYRFDSLNFKTSNDAMRACIWK